MPEAGLVAADESSGLELKREARRGHFAMLAFSALVAGSFSLGGMVANEIAPIALNTLRFAIAACVMGALALATGRISRATFRAPWRYGLLGFFLAIYFVLMFEGLKTAEPVSSAAVFTLTPVMSAVFGWILMRQITTARMALALAIGGAGALWVIFRADFEALLAFRIGPGEAIFFWGCMSHALWTPLSRFLNRGEHPFAYTCAMLIAAFFIVLAYGWRDIFATDWTALSPMVWVTIAYTSLVAGSGTFTLMQYATLRLPSAKVLAYTYLAPSWVILWEIAFGNGVPPVGILAGLGLTIVALWMLLKDE